MSGSFVVKPVNPNPQTWLLTQQVRKQSQTLLKRPDSKKRMRLLRLTGRKREEGPKEKMSGTNRGYQDRPGKQTEVTEVLLQTAMGGGLSKEGY